MADVPKARELLMQAQEYEMQDEARTLINEALELMYRDYSLGRKAPRKSDPVTAQLRHVVKMYAKAFPEMTQQDIAEKFNVNIGRVSEILRNVK